MEAAEVQRLMKPLPSPASHEASNCTRTLSLSGSVTSLARSTGRIRTRLAAPGLPHAPPGSWVSWDVLICAGGRL